VVPNHQKEQAMSNCKKQDEMSTGSAGDVTASTALVLIREPAGAVDELATLVASFAAEYSDLDSEINDLVSELLSQERSLILRYRDELLPMLNRMQMFLSQRGALYALVSEDRSLLRAVAQLEDVPTWTVWYEGFGRRFNGARSLRTVQRQLRKLRGVAPPEPAAAVADGEGVSGSDTATVLITGSCDPRDDGRTAAEPLPKVPLIECKVAPAQVQGAYATLGKIFNCMADTADIESLLQNVLEEIIQPMMTEHPYMQVDAPYRPEVQVHVQVHRAERTRISAGDWVEYRGGDDRLTKQIGAEAALGRVIEADAYSRPRITWAAGSKWLKPYSLFNEEAVHVLFADQAASAYSEAFSTYSEPTLSKLPTTAGIEALEDADESRKGSRA
jgi:hypothetical protein